MWELEQAQRDRARRRRQATVAPGPPAGRTEKKSGDVVCVRPTLKVGPVLYLSGNPIRTDPVTIERLLERRDAWRAEPSGIDWWKAPRRVLAVEPCTDQPLVRQETEGALRIAMGWAYDPGNAAYRLASAFNEHTKHAVAGIAWRRSTGNPFQCPQQYDAMKDMETARRLIYEADVLHSHMEFYLAGMSKLGIRPRRGQVVVKHYHGSLPAGQKQHPLKNAEHDDANSAILVAARLTLCALRPGRIHWLPIAVPVARYAAMAAARKPGKVLRIAHSATKEEYKGTRDLIAIVDALRAKGLPLELVLIGYRRTRHGLVPHRRTHAEALAIKATCDVTMDSLHWLGLQGSGLEAGAMGQVALAGDEDVAQLYRAQVGHVPYTHIAGGTTDERRRSLKDLLERLAVDVEFKTSEAARLNAYVRTYHDYPAVARIYESILERETGRAEVLTIRADLPKLPPVEPMRLPPTRRVH